MASNTSTQRTKKDNDFAGVVYITRQITTPKQKSIFFAQL